jgi:hypothetical protein
MDDERRSRLPAVLVALVIVVLPVLYLLAIGPLNALVEHGYIASESPICSALRMIYLPVVFVAEAYEPFGSALHWYLELWT